MIVQGLSMHGDMISITLIVAIWKLKEIWPLSDMLSLEIYDFINDTVVSRNVNYCQ